MDANISTMISRINFLFLLAFLAIVFSFFTFQIVHSDSFCHQITSGAPAPGFGAPYDVFNPSDILIKVTCGSSAAMVDLGKGDQNQYIYKLGYHTEYIDNRWNGWHPFDVTGATPTGAWFLGSANTSIPRTTEGFARPNVVVFYVCTNTGTAAAPIWKCGCATSACDGATSPKTGNLWQIQMFRREGGGDTTPPTASITAPAASTTVSNTVTFSANASDNVGITKVEFYVDGTLKNTDTASPYSFAWDTTNGGAHPCSGPHTHTLLAKAYDAAGNIGASIGVVVNMNNPAYCSTPRTLTVTKSGTESGTGLGTVTSNPVGITCGSICAANFTSGQVVTLSAVVNSGSVFAGWNGCDSTSGANCTVTMNAAKSVEALFGNASTTNPLGFLEEANSSVISGWTCDKNFFEQALQVHFYADGPAGTGAFIGSAIADISRDDVAGSCGGKKSHGFSFATPVLIKNGSSHPIYAYGIGVISTAQLSGSGSKSVSTSYTAPSSSLKNFGFAGVGGTPTYVDETMPYSNAPHMGVDPGVNYTSDITSINSKGGRPIVGVHNIFFIRSSGPAPSGNDWALHPDYIARWNAFRATHVSVLTPTSILALYMSDEPTWNGISANELKTATDLVAASYPTIPRIVVEAWRSVSQLVVPESMSWIAFDKYGVRDPATDSEYRSLYATLKGRRHSTSQKMFIIGDSWWAAGLHGANGITLADTAGVALNYYNFAKSDPDIVALIGFQWPSWFQGTGARDFPASTKATYKLIGQSITGK